MLERIAIGLLLWCCVTVIGATAMAFAFGGLAPWSAILSLVAGAGVAVFCVRWVRSSRPAATFGVGAVLAWCAFGYFVFRAFLWVIYTDGDRLMAGSHYNLGDLPLHIAFIRYLAGGVAFWPESPIFSGAALHYPIGTDLWNAVLVAAGFDLSRGLVWTGVLGGFCAAVSLQRWGGSFAMAGFLFAGGLAGWAFFSTGQLLDYQSSAEWKSLPLSMFVTQRGLLFALPAALFLLVSLRARAVGETTPLPLWMEVLFYATMPLFHIHTFLFLSVVYAFSFLLEPAEQRKHCLLVVGGALLPATLWVWLVTGLDGGGKIAWHPGWMQSGNNPLWFWLWNFGLFLPVGAAAIWIGLRRKAAGQGAVPQPPTHERTGEIGQGDLEPLSPTSPSRTALSPGLCPESRDLCGGPGLEKNCRASAVVHPGVTGFPCRGILVAAAVTFVACSLIRFAPWAWDNTKLMLWAYVALLPAIWEFVLRPLCIGWRIALCAGLFFSGGISLFGGLGPDRRPVQIASRQEIDQTKALVATVPRETRFAAFPAYNHPLLMLGRPVVAGYDGHLWSHGYDYSRHFSRLDELMQGRPGWKRLADELQAGAIFHGPRERKHYNTRMALWRVSALRAAADDSAEVFLPE